MISEVAGRLVAESLEFHYFNGGVTPLKKGHQTPWRSMPWTAVIHTEGGDVEVELDNGDVLNVPGGAALVAPGLTHRFLPLRAKQVVSRWAHMEFRVLAAVDVLSLFDVPHIFKGQSARALGRACETLAGLNRDGNLDFRALAAEKTLGFNMLDNILAQASWRGGALDFVERASRITPALTFIEEHLAESLSVEVVAKTVGLSVPHFYTVFKSVMGMPPFAYQRRRRLDRARILLTSSNRQVSEVAYTVGFCDPYHFSKQFKEAFGMSPSEYRE
jgi:AraC family transcriptional regulator of arabinose operon